VTWSGDDLEWFGSPYFVTPRLEGDTMRPREPDWQAAVPAHLWHGMAEQGARALAGIHRADVSQAKAYLGDFWGFEFDVTRWDRFAERAAEPERLALQPRVRQRLLDTIPADAHVGLYHGDFQWGNLLYSPAPECRLLAVLDWELTGIGATLNDIGWLCMFNDPAAWGGVRVFVADNSMPSAGELEAMYVDALGTNPGRVAWFRALAAYKFSIISGFNLMLHRRGKRHDPKWEETALAMAPLMEYAAAQLA
jgi:aminoglycoside phosphotransferase (APT) family kinase protein